MRLVGLFVCVFLLSGCSKPSKQEIIVPVLNAGFYGEALNQITEKLRSDPTNSDLVEQKLFYCNQLEWPATCLSALDEFQRKNGMSTQLADQYVSYYEINERYVPLIKLIDRWSQEFDLQDRFKYPFIQSLVATGNVARAKRELEVFLIENKTKEDVAFGANQYLQMGDTLLAVYQLSRLQKMDDGNELMYDYGKLLIHLGYRDRGFSLLEGFAAYASLDFSKSLELARIYHNEGRTTKARSLVKPFAQTDTISYLLSDWYARELLWDSAAMYLDTVLFADSTNVKAWWKKGRLYEDRAWLAYSLQFFEKMLEIDASDSMAINQIDKIQRKITYLQRKKFEESKIPILELESIKINN